MKHEFRFSALLAAVLVLGGCSDDDGTNPPDEPGPPVQLSVLGNGRSTERYTSEVAVLGSVAYTGTWSCRAACGNSLKVWDVSAATPVVIDSIAFNAGTVGDVQVSDDGKLLAVANEYFPVGALSLFDLTNPRKPTLITRFTTTEIGRGVHTVKLARINGRHYAFLSINPAGGSLARLVIADITTPAAPVQVYHAVMGNPFVHDVFVRDGVLFTALWDDGLTIWDVGGAASGGSPSSPVQLGNVKTVGGDVHNVFWFHDPSNNSKRYAFVGQESPGTASIGNKGNSAGDIHVLDVSNLRAPREVAFFHVDSAGVHNFAVDEPNGILYAAYYNAGVRAIDIRGDLSDCTSAQKSPDGRCDLGLMKRVRGETLTDRVVSIWGVAITGTTLLASDMLTGLFKVDIAPLKR